MGPLHLDCEIGGSLTTLGFGDPRPWGLPAPWLWGPQALGGMGLGSSSGLLVGVGAQAKQMPWPRGLVISGPRDEIIIFFSFILLLNTLTNWTSDIRKTST
jgi:hypothetical protein